VVEFPADVPTLHAPPKTNPSSPGVVIGVTVMAEAGIGMPVGAAEGA
jgi:hypothetical protein